MSDKSFFRRVVFFHLPKCAGTTLGVELRLGLGLKRRRRFTLPGHGAVWLNDVVPGHDWERHARLARSAKLVYGHMHQGSYDAIEQRSTDFSITYLRNPFERLLSQFRFERWHAIEHGLPLTGDPRTMLLSDYLSDTDPMRRMTMNNGMTRLLGGYNLNEPTSHAEWASLLHRAIEQLKTLTFVGFTESYNDDTDSLFQMLGAKRPDTPPTNVTTETAIREAEALDDRSTNPLAREMFDAYTTYDNLQFDQALKLRLP